MKKLVEYVYENGIKEIKGLEKARAIRDKLSIYCITLLEGLANDEDFLGLSIANDTNNDYASFMSEEYEYDEEPTDDGYYIQIKGDEGQFIIIPINNQSKLESVRLGADELLLTTNGEKFRIGYL